MLHFCNYTKVINRKTTQRLLTVKRADNKIMIDNRRNKRMELNGLLVDYDGNRNYVMYHGLTEYPIGGMISEYARMAPSEIKEIILSFPDKEQKPSLDNMSPFFPWFADKMEEKFGKIAAIIVTFEFMDLVVDYMDKKDTEELRIHLAELTSKEDSIKDFILKDTVYDGFGIDTVEQMLLTVYYVYAGVYVAFKHTFNMLATGEEYDEEQVTAFWSFYSDNMEFQHIDFKIACYEGAFHSLYTIKSSMSLILFEAAHCMDKEVNFVKCANCGEFFVPDGRSDMIYCPYPSPQNVEKTCRDIGAQITRSNKEKNDVVTREYRKIYMRYKMLTIRHPEDRVSKKKFEQLTNDVKQWRKDLAKGRVTTEEFLKWLEEYN